MNNIYDNLNDRQKEATFYTEGPLLILAGAGSGKTRVLMHRIAYLIQEKNVDPYNILAITFTNKAAKEMRERVDKIIEEGSEMIWVSTFHSTCVRILRRFIDRLGYENDFTIYDTEDQRTLVKKIIKEMNFDNKIMKERAVLKVISSCKDKLMSPSDFMREAVDYHERNIAKVYEAYQIAMKKNNALDFDDLILKTVELFKTDEQVLNYYQDRFRYIMVDEYQDTNIVQFKFIELLSEKYRNLCVVGDDDQSIYKFRGANIDNILGFEKIFEDAKVVKLEQNYRSTKNILEAANQVIRNNRGRKDKTLWTGNEEGVKLEFNQFDTADNEALSVVKDIKKKAPNSNYKDFAILYRTNGQSRIIEEKCVMLGLPYQLIGGVNFYQRKEIKDILAYIKTIASGRDDISLLRIINVPKRSIGIGSINKVLEFAEKNFLSLYDACNMARQIPDIKKAGERIEKFIELIEDYRKRLSEGMEISELITSILEDCGYKDMLYAEGEIEAEVRLENIQELINKSYEYKDLSVNEFLEDVALVADIDNLEDDINRVTLMTLHSAKGLEFPNVYIVGMEDGLFPGNQSILSNDITELEEERRLCYVGITRARENLMLSAARSRMINGERRFSTVSRFIREIPKSIMNEHRIESEKREDFRKQDIFGEGLPWNKAGKNSFKSHSSTSSCVNTLSFGKAFEIKKAMSLDYSVGDKVRHVKFGIGKVEAIKDGNKDYEVTVDFEKFGIKRMFATFAKLEKI